MIFMHKKAEELMFADLLRFGESGRVDLFGNAAFLFPADYVHRLEEKITSEEVYSYSKKIPDKIISILRERGMKDLERLDFLLELAEVLGMGNVNVPSFDQTKKNHEVVIKNANSNKVSCHHTRGYLATVFSDCLKRKFECEETTCVSKGGENCTFVLLSKD